MTDLIGTPDYAHGTPDRVGVLLVNLGTPDDPSPGAVRRYLAEFLRDPRIIEMPRALWWLVLHGVILRTRPKRSAHAYRRIWTPAGSPLLLESRALGDGLAQRLRQRCGEHVVTELAMTYGQPSIAAALTRLRQQNVRHLLVVPLYPQYSSTTTGSVFDLVTRELRRWRWLPELRFITHYHDDPAYLDALATHIAAARGEQPAERLLFSFHGLPQRNLLAGDPYHCQCHKTARLVAERLGLSATQWAVAFQSRFGRAEWLQPYTSELLAVWARAGVSSVDVVCPGFAADCLETLEEIALANRQVFLEAGGTTYRYLPALNDDPGHIAALAGLVERHAAGWPELDAAYDADAVAAERAARLQRARALGTTD